MRWVRWNRTIVSEECFVRGQNSGANLKLVRLHCCTVLRDNFYRMFSSVCPISTQCLYVNSPARMAGAGSIIPLKTPLRSGSSKCEYPDELSPFQVLYVGHLSAEVLKPWAV